jgi:hypothetical protein
VSALQSTATAHHMKEQLQKMKQAAENTVTKPDTVMNVNKFAFNPHLELKWLAFRVIWMTLHTFL